MDGDGDFHMKKWQNDGVINNTHTLTPHTHTHPIIHININPASFRVCSHVSVVGGPNQELINAVRGEGMGVCVTEQDHLC